MICGESYIKRLSAWAPGLRNLSEWNEWAGGSREMCQGSENPDIAFTDPLLRRRLSQISKMTIQVVHDLLPLHDDTKIVFLSFRGELSKQYKINKMQIEEGTITPAAFSFSVFNTPVAVASMALGLKGGYTAIYPGENSFNAGLKTASAALHSGVPEELVFVYADEEVPEEYAYLLSERPSPFAFGLLLNRISGHVPLSSLTEAEGTCQIQTPLAYLKSLLLSGKLHVPP